MSRILCAVAVAVGGVLALPSVGVAQQAGESVAAAPFRFEFLSVRRAVPLVESGRVQVLDTRPVAKYLAGHLPGAVHLRDESVREAAGCLPAQMLPDRCLADLFGRVGISAEKAALVYSDGEDPLSATLVAYALIKAGHRDVRVLDGGFAAWQGTGPTSQAFPTIEPSTWTGVPDSSLAATLGDVREALRTEEVELIDARPAKSFRGEGKAFGRNGHIPGAVNLDWKSLVVADNESLLKPAAEIAALVTKSGAEATDRTIVYCATGREATFLYLYLRGVQGWPRVRLYEGSWTEYQSIKDLPVETGESAEATVRSDGEVTISGQPSALVLRELADRGTRLVVNCRTAGEAKQVGFGERGLVELLGMKYVEIPLGGSDGYEPADVAKLSAILKEHGGTQGVHLHCAGGPRAANLWAAYLVKERGMAPAEAVSRLRAAGIMRETAMERLLGEALRLEVGK